MIPSPSSGSTMRSRGTIVVRHSPTDATLGALRSHDQEPLMSHFSLSLSHFFHGLDIRLTGHVSRQPVSQPYWPTHVPEAEAPKGDDLAFFGLTREHQPESPYAELERLSMTLGADDDAEFPREVLLSLF